MSNATRTAGLAFGALVAVVAAVASYSHMRELAAAHGEEWLSWIVPLSVDGLLVVASLVIVEARRTGCRAPWLAWLALVAGVLVSLAANVAAAAPEPLSRAVAAWPPLAFAAVFELVLWLTRATRGRAVVERADGVDEPVVTSDDTAVIEQARALYQHDPEIGRKRLRDELGRDRVTDYQARQILNQLRSQRPSLHAVGDEL